MLRSLRSEGDEAKDRVHTSDSWQYEGAPRVHGVCTTVDLTLNDVLWSLKDLAFKVIVDLGCMRSAAGVSWVNVLLR